MSYYIAKIRSFYGPREELSFAQDERGERLEFGTVLEAKNWIDEAEAGTYVLASGESSRPEHVVVDQDAVDWLDWEDDSKYDWDGCECRRDAGAPCGDCDECLAWKADENVAYVRAHVVRTEMSYQVWLVPNGASDDFCKRGMTSSCQLWGAYHDVKDAADRVRELAEEETLKERFCEYDETAVRDFVEKAEHDMGFEWDGDLKWVRVAKFCGDEFVEVV